MKSKVRIERRPARKRYDEEFKQSAVEMVVRGGRPLSHVARDLGVSEPTLHLWKKKALDRLPPIQHGAKSMSAQEMAQELRLQQKEIEWLKRQRDILKKAMSILGEDPSARMQ